MNTIIQANPETHREAIKDLWWEYLVWANERTAQEYNIRLDIEAALEADLSGMQKFLPPTGRLLLAQGQEHTLGCVCLKQVTPQRGEIKRLYVRPQHRGLGTAKKLVEQLLDEARQIGYQTIRLDSARFMTDAHALYRGFGFQEIAPYPESEIPAEYHQFWLFMERSL